MPDDFRDALIVSLYKKKGGKSNCRNYGGISFLSVAGKIFSRVILNRLITVSEQTLPEAQCGLRSGRITVYMIFAVTQLQEKCIEQNKPHNSVFIDLTKALTPSTGRHFGQFCVLAPVLFNVFFTCMLSHAVQDLEKGVYIRYCLDGSLFDLRRLTAKTKSLQTLLQSVLFADDCALVAHAEQDLQQMLDCFSEASQLFGPTISLGKTEVP